MQYSVKENRKPLLGLKRGADGPTEAVRKAQVPLFKGGRRCFRRLPQVAYHEDLSLVGRTTRRLANLWSL